MDILEEYAITLIEMGFSWMVICVPPDYETAENNVYHVVGYPEKPTDNDMEALIQEFEADPEFGMQHLKYEDDYQMYVGTCEDMLKPLPGESEP